jgi:tonB-linked outer membrane protein, susC/ragA family
MDYNRIRVGKWKSKMRNNIMKTALFMEKKKVLVAALLIYLGIPGYAQDDSTEKNMIKLGHNIEQNIEESTASVSIITNEELNKRSAKNVTNSLYGYGLGLTVLQNGGIYVKQEPTLYVRGIQSLSGSTPLMLVDGIERDISLVTPEEVESVQILKDAAAIALYGYKGANGVINVITKRGKYNSRQIKFTYDHVINWEVRRPEFADSYMYANAINEALANDGKKPRYHELELEAFKTGEYPYYYPNVNWIDEVFKNTASTNLYNISFQGGGEKFRYYAYLNLLTDKGFIANANENDGYSTQNKYSKANLRTNMDIDLSANTKLKLNILGTLAESSKPGASADLWNMIYTVPSAAFPIKTEDGLWGGNSTWSGTLNPVAQSQAAAYTKGHIRSLYADMTLRQNLSSVLPGLGANLMVAYDNLASYVEDHSKTYVYGSDVLQWMSGAPRPVSRYTAGTESPMGDGSSLDVWRRALNTSVGLDYSHAFGSHKLYSQLKWDYECRNTNGIDNTWFRQNLSLYTHYGYKERYFVDLALVGSASNKLAPGTKWAFSPTVSAAWVLSKEKFMENIECIDLLKLRGSWGIIKIDNIPGAGYWEEVYAGGGNYSFNANYDNSGVGSWKLSQLASLNGTHEKAHKYNLGLDARMFKGLALTVDGYYQRRSDIWVATEGKYSTVLGFNAPYENAGIVDSWGVEVGLNYTKQIGEVMLNAGGNFALSKNKIIEQLEEPRIYDNLVTTGLPVNQLTGLQAIGLFKDEDDIANSPEQLFSVVKPGDIKYRDVNEDGVIDGNDKIAIGYNTDIPEIYYSFNIGAEWKGLGFSAIFQGTARYSAVLNTTSLFWPLVNNTNISRYYYENRWTPETPDAKFPRLTTESNKNNFQTSTLWLEDRSFLKLRNVEVYYNFPESWMKRIKFMSNMKIYVRGNDLLCFDHIKIADPESYGINSPLTRSVVAGLTIGF